MKNAPARIRVCRFSATDASATLMLARTSAGTAATVAKSAMQTYIDSIRDLA